MGSKASETLKLMMRDASADDWARYVEMGNKNFWTLQNHWMMNVEKKYGQAAAVQLDGLCYGRAIEVAAYRLLKFFGFGDDDLTECAPRQETGTDCMQGCLDRGGWQCSKGSKSQHCNHPGALSSGPDA